MKQCRQWHTDARTGIAGASVLHFDLGTPYSSLPGTIRRCSSQVLAASESSISVQNISHHKQPLHKIMYFKLEVALILVSVNPGKNQSVRSHIAFFLT